MYLLKTLVFVLLIVLANSDVWAIRNDQIASVALQHNGEGGFTCKEFIQHVFTHLGGSLGAGYRQCYFDFPGGREITNVVEVIRGDIVQVSDDVYNGLVKLDTKFAETRENDKMKIYDQTTKNI